MDEALVKKLRVPTEGNALVLEPPDGYLDAIGLSESDAALDQGAAGAYDFVQVFAGSQADVRRLAPAALRAAKPDGLVWFCYPKGTSKLKSDLNRDAGWEPVTAAGWEGVSLVSVDDTWSAMRFRPLAAVGKSRPDPAARRAAAAAKPSAEPLEPPADLLSALEAAPEASAMFGRLAPSHKKEYVSWIVEAKKAETRASRVAKTVDKLSKGLKRPSDKE